MFDVFIVQDRKTYRLINKKSDGAVDRPKLLNMIRGVQYIVYTLGALIYKSILLSFLMFKI